MARGNRAKSRDDGAGLPSDPPECLTNASEREAYDGLVAQLERIGQDRAADLAIVCIAAKQMARLALLQAKLDAVIASGQLVIG